VNCRAFGSAEFQALFGRYPDSIVAAPHVFTKVAVVGICAASRFLRLELGDDGEVIRWPDVASWDGAGQLG
jgi:hypothetical protein